MRARLLFAAGLVALSACADAAKESATVDTRGDGSRELSLPPVDPSNAPVASTLELPPEPAAATTPTARRPRAVRPASSTATAPVPDHSASAAAAPTDAAPLTHPRVDEAVASGPSAEPAAEPAVASGTPRGGGKPGPGDIAVRPDRGPDWAGVPVGQIPGGDQWDDPLAGQGRGNGGPIVIRGGGGNADDPCDVHVPGNRMPGAGTAGSPPPPLINERMPRRGPQVADRGTRGPGLPRGGIRF